MTLGLARKQSLLYQTAGARDGSSYPYAYPSLWWVARERHLRPPLSVRPEGLSEGPFELAELWVES